MKKRNAAPRERLREFAELCRREGLPLTVQRRTILEAVLVRQDHPTAEQLFDDVQERLPGVSRTTVYRVLDTLVRVGVIHRLSHPGTAARFDPKVHQHHHLVCLQCGQIRDVEDGALDALKLPAINAAGYEISEFHIHFRGTCPACQRRGKKAAGAKPSHQGRPKSTQQVRTRSPKRPKREQERRNG